jgi:hypothetical protein
VGQRELEREQERGGQGRQLEGALLPRDERGDRGERDDPHLDDGLERREVGDPAGVVLAPAPEREGRLAVELESERPLPERAERVPEGRLEEQDREGEQRRDAEAEREPRQASRLETRRVRQPERRDDERRELRPRGERHSGPARGR